ncbi:MAG: arsenic resistance N-acetyltransferase ArsN2 [Chloroflexota bacterium]
MNKIVFRNATSSDWNHIAQLLQEAKLPLDGAQDHLDHFVLAIKDESLIGCAGLEIYGECALLRSVAVSAGERGKGLGIKLVRQILDRAKEDRIHTIILLTETAQNFFPKFGFRIIKRDDAPAPVKESVEFKGACCESAVTMRLDLADSVLHIAYRVLRIARHASLITYHAICHQPFAICYCPNTLFTAPIIFCRAVSPSARCLL